MEWLELLKDLLKSVTKILVDIPVWAKTTICLLVISSGLLCVGFVLVTTAQQMFVFRVDVTENPEPTEGARYLVVHTKSGYQTQYQTNTNDIIRAVVPVRVGLLEELGREFEIRRRTTTSGEAAPRAKFEFSGPRPRQSDFIDLSVVCKFAAASDCGPPGPRSSVTTPAMAWSGTAEAYAAESEAPNITVPTLETLRELAPDAGYMEVRLIDLRVNPERCRRDCSTAVFWRVEWNGVAFLFDGIAPEATRKSDIEVKKEGELRRTVSFGIENTLFRESGNVLRVSFYARRPFGSGVRLYEQFSAKETPELVDVFETPLEVLRTVSAPITGKQMVMAGRIHGTAIQGRLGRSKELFIGAGTLGDVSAKRDFVNKTLSRRIALDGSRIVAVVRPPLKSNNMWGVVVGIGEQGTDRVRLLLSDEEAKSLLAQFRQLPDSELRPLTKGEFFVQSVVSHE